MEYDRRYSSFYFRRPSSTVILMLHGFTGSPFYLQPFGRSLAELGVSVFGKQLAGHGTTPLALAETTYEDWRGSVLDAFLWLSDRYKEIFVIGHSLGAALGMDLGCRFPGHLSGVVTIGAPYAIRHHLLHRSLLPFIRRVKKFHHKRGITIRNYFRSTGCYESFPLPALKELYAYINQVYRPSLPRFIDPLLVIQPGNDDLVQVFSGRKIIQRVASSKKKYSFHPEMEHNPFVSLNPRSPLLKEVWNFLSEQSHALQKQHSTLPVKAVVAPVLAPNLKPQKYQL